ncbi:MAG: class II aldolase [Phycisphaeraceae bacterium]|nr:class II aldolase [Phycisphaeraceae bacterium]
MTEQNLLAAITKLSHEFGTGDYVLGGGGNTSVKNETTLWVKPSGTTLGALTPETFVAMSRAKLAELYEVQAPAESHAREALVKTYMEKAVLPDSTGRASVEAPLHSTLNARYVVHTHPTLVNGMTCAKDGKAACQTLFPEALWLDFIDPGFTLCIKVRQEILQYRQTHGYEPALIFLKNHGVFVAGDSPEAIQSLYAHIFETLQAQYDKAGIVADVARGACAAADSVSQSLRSDLGWGSDIHMAVSALFQTPQGPISPDHIVYAKSYPLMGHPTQDAIQQYNAQYGYDPAILQTDQAVIALGSSELRANLALEMAIDGAQVTQLAQAFGGLEYMTERAREFIENWEVESYRSKQL